MKLYSKPRAKQKHTQKSEICLRCDRKIRWECSGNATRIEQNRFKQIISSCSFWFCCFPLYRLKFLSQWMKIWISFWQRQQKFLGGENNAMTAHTKHRNWNCETDRKYNTITITVYSFSVLCLENTTISVGWKCKWKIIISKNEYNTNRLHKMKNQNRVRRNGMAHHHSHSHKWISNKFQHFHVSTDEKNQTVDFIIRMHTLFHSVYVCV